MHSFTSNSFLQLAHQAKGNQEEYGAVVDKQFSLESTYKDVSGQLEQRKQENRELMRKLESERGTVGEKTRELEQLQSQLSLQEKKHKLLVEKVQVGAALLILTNNHRAAKLLLNYSVICKSTCISCTFTYDRVVI